MDPAFAIETASVGPVRPNTRLRLIEGRSRPSASRSNDPDLLIRAVRFLDLGSINFDRTPQSIGLSRSRLVRRSIQHHDRPAFSRSTLGRHSVGPRSIQSIEPRSATSGESWPRLSRSRRFRKLEDRLIDSRLPIRYRFRSGRADFGSLEGRPVSPEPPVRNPFHRSFVDRMRSSAGRVRYRGSFEPRSTADRTTVSSASGSMADRPTDSTRGMQFRDSQSHFYIQAEILRAITASRVALSEARHRPPRRPDSHERAAHVEALSAKRQKAETTKGRFA